MEKTCNKCNVSKLFSEFHKANRNCDGYFNTCKKCRQKMDSDYYKNSNKKFTVKKRRQKLKTIMLSYKIQCKYCPENISECLDFHHKYGKEFNVAESYTRYSEKRLLDEIAKCDVVCSNCHRKIHAGYEFVFGKWVKISVATV